MNFTTNSLANGWVSLTKEGEKHYPIGVFNSILFEIAEKYGVVDGYLNPAIEFARTRGWFMKK
jgi:hypothetical protein